MLRVGLIGAGQVAERHAAAYSAHPDAEVVAVADPDRGRGEALASRTAAAWTPSVDALLDSHAVDAVSICIPHDLHLPAARAAAERGVHILLEKPIANTLDEADEITSAAEAAGVTLMIGFVHRFRQEVLEAKRLIDDEAIGRPTLVLDKFCSLGGPHPPAWVWDRGSAGGGVLMYGGIHAIDRLLWLLGRDVVSVVAEVRHSYGFGDVEDGLVALLTLSDGTAASLFENSPPFGRPGGWATEIFGTKGAIRIQTGEWVELTSPVRSFTLTVDAEEHFEREIAEFVSAIREDRPPSVTAEDGRRALAVALAIYEAAASHTRIETRATAAGRGGMEPRSK